MFLCLGGDLTNDERRALHEPLLSRIRTASRDLFADELAATFDILGHAPHIGRLYRRSPVPDSRRIRWIATTMGSNAKSLVRLETSSTKAPNSVKEACENERR